MDSIATVQIGQVIYEVKPLHTSNYTPKQNVLFICFSL